jgi:hypothetical protein
MTPEEFRSLPLTPIRDPVAFVFKGERIITTRIGRIVEDAGTYQSHQFDLSDLPPDDYEIEIDGKRYSASTRSRCWR